MAERDESANGLVLGIDTGGTYTDGVLLAYHSRRVLATHKSLTTKRDLSLGIEAVIEGIHIEDPTAVKMVSISTTLATNAIAEGNLKRVALLLLGYDPDLIASFKMEKRFATPHYAYFGGGHDYFGREKEPLDLPALRASVQSLKGQVDAIAVSSYFSPLNPAHEMEAFEAITQVCELPVVLGHQLSTKLGSVERATTAALNASLLAVLQEFVQAVRQALARRQIKAPLMVVRGDGTLMSAEFAAHIPVETIHSGPAASAIGGRFLSRLDNALVVDVGGTTTDIALIEEGRVAISEEGATVGHYKTAVQAANLHSIALGGDSHITLSNAGELLIGPQRVMPLAHLAHQYPRAGQRLKALSLQSWTQAAPEWLQYWFLLREPPAQTLQSAQEKALVALLQTGPRPLPEILKQLGLLHASQLYASDLLRREIIGRAGLTPTDLLHAEGRYTFWDSEAASVALETLCRYQQWDSSDFRQRVWQQTTEMITRAILTFLTGKSLHPPVSLQDDDIGYWFFENSLYDTHPHLETRFRLRQPIIGIGAPAAFFLQDVAEVLHTELILPRHYPVANAVGAVAGSVMVVEEVLIYPRLSRDGVEVISYYVQGSNGRQEFEALGDALRQARTSGREEAFAAAVRAGAANPQVMVEEVVDGMDTYRIRAKAVGNPHLGTQTP